MDDTINVLLVDDEDEFLQTLSEQLQGRGFNVLSAGECDEALEIMKGIRIDAVVLDAFMPEKDGIQTLTEMKKQHPSTPVILLSGVAELEFAVKGMQSGAFDYLLKPSAVDARMVDLLKTRIDAAQKRAQLRKNLRDAERAQ